MVGFCEHGNEPFSPINKAGYSLTFSVTNDFKRISCTMELVS
jgi:hypothetical protein